MPSPAATRCRAATAQVHRPPCGQESLRRSCSRLLGQIEIDVFKSAADRMNFDDRPTSRQQLTPDRLWRDRRIDVHDDPITLFQHHGYVSWYRNRRSKRPLDAQAKARARLGALHQIRDFALRDRPAMNDDADAVAQPFDIVEQMRAK